ncbi:TPA: hypothetical protein NHK58_001401 [Pseudomonas aeruginosa]|nr:hypothetical protein [Pseudomonas aeruginosa]
MKIKSLALSLIIFLSSISVFADDCLFYTENIDYNEELSSQCRENISKTNIIVNNVKNALTGEKVGTIYSLINSMEEGDVSLLGSGDKFTDIITHAIAEFLYKVQALIYIIVFVVVMFIAKVAFAFRKNPKEIGSQFKALVFKLLSSLGIFATYLTLVSIVVLAAIQSVEEFSYKVVSAYKDYTESAESIASFIDYRSKPDSEFINSLLKTAYFEYKTEKDLVYSKSFDVNNIFREDEFAVCLTEKIVLDENLKGYWNSKELDILRLCALELEGTQDISSGLVSFDEKSSHIADTLDDLNPLLLDFAYKLDTYTCNKTARLNSDFTDFADGKNCADYNPKTKRFSISGNGKAILTDKKVSYEDLIGSIQQIENVIKTANKAAAIKEASKIEVKPMPVTFFDIVIILLNEHETVSKLKEAASSVLNFKANYIGTIQFSEAETQFRKEELVEKGGAKTLQQSLRAFQVVDEYTNKDRIGSLDFIKYSIAENFGGGYLSSIGVNENKERDFNVISSMYYSTKELAFQALTSSIALKFINKMIEPFGSKSDSEIPNTTIITAEKGISLIYGFMFGIFCITFPVCVFLLFEPAKYFVLDCKAFILLVIRACTTIPIMVIVDMWKNENGRWIDSALERSLVLVYIFLDLFFMVFKFIMIFVIVYIVAVQFDDIMEFIKYNVSVFGIDGSSISGILSQMILLGLVIVMNAWICSRVIRSVFEQMETIKSVYSFGSGSAMNYNMNGRVEKNAWNSYMKK